MAESIVRPLLQAGIRCQFRQPRIEGAVTFQRHDRALALGAQWKPCGEGVVDLDHTAAALLGDVGADDDATFRQLHTGPVQPQNLRRAQPGKQADGNVSQ